MTFRHRIDLYEYGETQNEWGDVEHAYSRKFKDVPAEWISGPGREFLADEATRAETTGRFKIRWVPGVHEKMQVHWDGKVFEIKAPPQPDSTGRRELLLMVGSVK